MYQKLVVTKKFLRSVRHLLVTANIIASSPILVTLIKEALISSETLVLTTATRRNISEDAIPQSKGNSKLNRNQLWRVVGLLTGQGHLKGHLFKLGLVNSLRCKRCLEKEEPTTHILHDFEAIGYLRSHHMVRYFLEPSGYHESSGVRD
jgi:hypothetical protein